MSDRIPVPREPTLDMCIAYMRAQGWTPRFIAQWTEYLKKNLGGPHECSFVCGLRAAIAVGAGFPLDQVKRGQSSHDCFETHGRHRRRKAKDAA